MSGIRPRSTAAGQNTRSVPDRGEYANLRRPQRELYRLARSVFSEKTRLCTCLRNSGSFQPIRCPLLKNKKHKTVKIKFEKTAGMIPDRDTPPHDAFSRGRTASLSPERTQTAPYMITTLLSFQGHSFLRRIFPPDRFRNRYGACRDDTPRKNPDKAAHSSSALSRTAPFRNFPVRLRRTGAHGNSTSSASFRRRRPKIAHGLPPGSRPPFFFPSKRSDTVPQVRNARRRQPFPSRAGHRPAKRTLRRSGRPGVFLTGTAATKCRYGRHETAIAVPRHEPLRKRTERERPHSAECGRFSQRRAVRTGRSPRCDQSNAAIFSSSTLSGHTPT